ncbi:hypothetical protein TNCV_2781821 [Trichonephila clavipes]|nr:hypothetical protein TNCV_2781821 [Trichonephila clavipes]
MQTSNKSVCTVARSRWTNFLRWPQRKNPLVILAAIELDIPFRSKYRGMSYPANPVQEYRNAPEPHHVSSSIHHHLSYFSCKL